MRVLLYACMCTSYIKCLRRPEEGIRTSGVLDCPEIPCSRCWVPNPDLLPEQLVFLIADSCLKPPKETSLKLSNTGLLRRCQGLNSTCHSFRIREGMVSDVKGRKAECWPDTNVDSPGSSCDLHRESYPLCLAPRGMCHQRFCGKVFPL